MWGCKKKRKKEQGHQVGLLKFYYEPYKRSLITTSGLKRHFGYKRHPSYLFGRLERSDQIQYCHGCGIGLSSSSNSTPGLGTSICHRCTPKKKRKEKEKNPLRQMTKHTIQNLRDASKAVHRRKSMAIQAFLKKQKSQINNLTYHLKELEEEVQTKPTAEGRKSTKRIVRKSTK